MRNPLNVNVKLKFTLENFPNSVKQSNTFRRSQNGTEFKLKYEPQKCSGLA